MTVQGPTPYEIVIGAGTQAELGLVLAGTAKAAVVHAPPLAAAAGAAVETLQSAGVAAEAVVVPDGEAAKTAEVAAGLWEEFGRLGLTRSDVMLLSERNDFDRTVRLRTARWGAPSGEGTPRRACADGRQALQSA